MIGRKNNMVTLLLKILDERLDLHSAAEPFLKALSHPFMFFLDEFIVGQTLRAEGYSVFIKKTGVSQAGTLGQYLIQLLFFIITVLIGRRKHLAAFLNLGVGFLIHPLFSDAQHLRKIAMNSGLEDLVALKRSELGEVHINKRRGGQEHRHPQSQD